MALNRFTEQTELRKLFDTYYQAVTKLHPQQQPWPRFADQQILRSLNDEAVYFSPEFSLLRGDKQDRENESKLAIQISTRLLDCASYFLAQRIHPDALPEQFKLCFAACHENRHWTGLIVTVNTFNNAYRQLYTDLVDHLPTAADRQFENLRFLDAKTKIEIFLKIRDAFNPNKLLITDEQEKTKKTLSFFSPGILNILSLDSLNYVTYANRIEESLHMIKSKVNLTSIPCTQQQGNLCGDETILNLIVGAILTSNPLSLRRQFSTPTAIQLRELTDALKNVREASPNEIANAVAILRQALPNLASRNSTEARVAESLIAQLSEVENQTTDLLLELHEITGQATPTLIHQMLLNQPSHGNIKTMIATYNSQPATKEKLPTNNNFETQLFNLAKLLHGKNAFFEKNVAETDKDGLIALAQITAYDFLAGIEHHQLRNAKTRIALDEQQKALDGYKPSPPKKKKIHWLLLILMGMLVSCLAAGITLLALVLIPELVLTPELLTGIGIAIFGTGSLSTLLYSALRKSDDNPKDNPAKTMTSSINPFLYFYNGKDSYKPSLPPAEQQEDKSLTTSPDNQAYVDPYAGYFAPSAKK